METHNTILPPYKYANYGDPSCVPTSDIERIRDGTSRTRWTFVEKRTVHVWFINFAKMPGVFIFRFHFSCRLIAHQSSRCGPNAFYAIKKRVQIF